MTRRWGHAMGEDDDENIAGGRAGGHRRCPVPALVLVACVLFGQACICDAQLSPSSDIAMVRRDEGVCNGVDIRNDVSTFDRLRGCRVIEGSLQIVLMDADEEKLTNYTFPELREITGYLLLYRVQGLRSLSRLFPNLAVIRGDTLFFNFALVIYEMKNLQEVGLHSLTHVIRGAVNIERNSLLCYVDTIDWGHIAKHGKELHVVSGNRQRNECPGCVETCSKSPTKNEPLCWNRQHCQKVTSSCPENSNCSSKMCNENGTCCHENCIGGCFGEGADNCVACKNVYWNGKCITKCPFNTYEYLNRRCIEEAECRSMKVSETADESAKLKSMIPFNNSCTAQCPANHQETIVEQDGKPVYLSKDVEKRPKYTCKPCHGSQCRKECDGINVDSIQAAQRLRGCTHITGGLEITLRGGKNFVRELEENLNSIQEIEHYLKIVRTSPIVSLNFLRNLTTIHGKKLEQEKYAFVVKDNINLQELWDWNTKKSFRILNGKLFFHNNPKLCFNKIVQLKEEAKMPDFTDTEVARDSNGDKIACNVTVLEAGVKVLGTEGVILEWKSYKHHDSRELLGYVIYYTEAPSKNITLFDGRDACGNDGWIVDDVSVSPDSQEENHLIAHMKPYTQYAYYIKTYMISTGGSGAQSPLQYFRTKPSIPSVPRHLRAYSNSSSEIVVQWLPPSEPNGNITHYIVEAIFEGHDANFLDQRDYCKDKMLALVPEKKSSLPPIITIVKDEKLGGLGEKGSCPCAAEEKKSQHTDEQEAQYQITFEDYLQNNIYYKRPANNRRKREISNLSALTENLQVVDMVKIEFPNDKNGPATPEPPYQLANKQDRGKYIHYRTEVKETIAVIRQLKHFGGYSISVSACREIVAGEVNANACSTVSMVTARTMKLDNADDLEVTKIHTEVGNSTQDSYGKVKVRWEEPEEPNGIIVAYVLEYRRVEPLLKPIQECISRQDYQSNGNSFVIGEAGSLEPGNYSISIRATSLAGQGVPTALRYFTIEKSPSKSSQYLILIIIVSGFVVILAFGLLLQNHRKKTHLANMKIIATVNPEYISTIYVPDEWEVPRKKIEFVKELGQGSFGMVYEGIVRDIQGKSEAYCAIKTAGAQATDRERMDFLKEASVMKEFKTHHVVQLLGVVSQGCPELPALVIMELMANGDLKTYLRSHRPDETNDPNIRPPSLKKTLQMAVEIADGMAYLAFKKFVHRDLAARNCMVASDLTVKIGDFGMTRDIYDTDYYRKDTKGLLPVRWMAPESLRDGIFTSSSDVWSYGVVLWEMATLALQPYQGLSNDQVLKYVSDGGTMEPPENCPKRLFELMHLCWKKKPQHRPSFLELVTRLLPESVENFHEVSFYHQPEHKDLRDSAMATVLAKTKARAITTPPQPVEQENFHIENSEDEEEVGERAALTSSSRGGGSPLRPPPSIMQTSTASANNNGPKVVNGGGGGGSGQANGFLGGYNHRNHTNHHNHGLNHSASSSSEPHKTTEC